MAQQRVLPWKEREVEQKNWILNHKTRKCPDETVEKAFQGTYAKAPRHDRTHGIWSQLSDWREIGDVAGKKFSIILKSLEKLAKGKSRNQDKVASQESDMVRFYFSGNLTICVEDY